MTLLIAATLSCFFPLHIEIFLFLFQDYQYIVDTDFLKAEMQKILSLSDKEASAINTSSTESLDGPAFLPICLWPGEVQHLFHKSKIGYIDTFKFVLSVFGNNMFPHLLLSFLFIKYRKNPGNIPKPPSKYSGSLTRSLRRNTYVITSM